MILFAGRLSAQKQPMVLARTLYELAGRAGPFLAIVAGDGEQRAELERFIHRKRLKRRVKMVGEVSSEKMRDLMSASDIFFLPSEWEGIALSLFEAMSMGLVIVSAEVGGQRELVTQDCGVLLPRADEATELKAYAEALNQLLADPARCEALGRCARARVRSQFNLDQMVDRFVDLFDEAAKRRAAREVAPLDRRIATAWAVHGVEYLRLSQVADALWAERQKLVSDLAAPEGASSQLVTRLSTQVWLDHIEGARSWRWIRRIHRSLPGRCAQRMGWARDLEAVSAIQDPQLRASEIQSTLSFRLMDVVKSTVVYRLWARLRYGEYHDPRRHRP